MRLVDMHPAAEQRGDGILGQVIRRRTEATRGNHGSCPLERFANVAAKNQQYADPCHTNWNPVFHFAGPIAAITTPRRFAACRNRVMKISRPSTITTIQAGSPTAPTGVANGNVGASMYIGTKVPT